MEHGSPLSQQPPPATEEFEAARQRELARLDMRIGPIKGRKCHPPEDEELLEGDGADLRTADMDVVRRWSQSSPKHGGGAKNAQSPGRRGEAVRRGRAKRYRPVAAT